jgi:hypothetical protein
MRRRIERADRAIASGSDDEATTAPTGTSPNARARSASARARRIAASCVKPDIAVQLYAEIPAIIAARSSSGLPAERAARHVIRKME